MSAAHAENDHFAYDITSKVKTKFLGNSIEIYPLGRYELLFDSLPNLDSSLLDNSMSKNVLNCVWLIL